jgi:hypothetical protein
LCYAKYVASYAHEIPLCRKAAQPALAADRVAAREIVGILTVFAARLGGS